MCAPGVSTASSSLIVYYLTVTCCLIHCCNCVFFNSSDGTASKKSVAYVKGFSYLSLSFLPLLLFGWVGDINDF